MSKKVLLTSVCRPMGPQDGDAPSVGYELLYRQVTRAQGIFSPRTVNVIFGLDYIAENLDAPTVVLQYPSKRELIKELKKGYDYVGISFIMAVMHKMKEMVALIRKYAPNSKIVLGGYGTVLKDEVLKPYARLHLPRGRRGVHAPVAGRAGNPDAVQASADRELAEGVRLESVRHGENFRRTRLPERLRFLLHVAFLFAQTHQAAADRHGTFTPSSERYLDLDPSLVFLILDEDFLLNKKRAMEFRDCVMKGGKKLSIFAFSSIKAISQYTVEEILEMGIDGFWIGYEGTRSNYAKQQGRPVDGNSHRISRARHHRADLDDCRVRLSDPGSRGAGTGRADEAQAGAGAVSDLRAGARHAVSRARHQGEPVAGRLHQRQGFVLPARGRLHAR